MMRVLLILFAIVSLGVPVMSMQSEPQSARVAASEDLKPMPVMKLLDLSGKQVRAEQFKNSVVIVDFWATWCGPCILEIPFLNRLQEKYKSRGLKVVGVTLASGDAAEVKPFVSRFKMAYPVLMGDEDQAYEFNILGFPTTYLLTRDWKVYRKYVGSGPSKAQRIESDINQLLDGKPQAQR